MLTLIRISTKFACECSQPVGLKHLRWNSSNNQNWKPGTSWRKVSRSEYNKSYFNLETVRSKLDIRRFRRPTWFEVLEFLWKGPKWLRIPVSVRKIKPVRGYIKGVCAAQRDAYVFSFFRVFYNYMDNPAKNVMLYYRPTVFSAFFATAGYVGCTIWSYEDHHRNLRTSTTSPSQSNWKFSLPKFGTSGQTTTADGDVTTLSEWVVSNVRDLRKQLKHWWNYQATDADLLFWPICGINTMVYLAWRLDVFAVKMVQYFTASPTSRYICTPFLFSAFSHYSFTHLALNMFVLHSFLPAAVSVLGKHYALYLYLTGGVLSSYGSHMFKMFKGSVVPSLGASGAIMAVLGFVCTQAPDAKLGIVFIPGLNFSADTGLKCLMTMDFVGMCANWSLMDHAAHFSGAVFGILFSHALPHLEPVREYILKSWHAMRTMGRD